MSSRFIFPLVVCMAFAIAIGLCLDGTSSWWNPERLVRWPFRSKLATNRAIFLCLLTLTVLAVGLLVMRVWPP